MEKERPRTDSKKEDDEELEHTVTIGGKPQKVSLPSGARLSDLLRKFLEENPKLNLTGHSIMCNSKLIEHDDGKLKEDPLLVQASVVTIAAKISGGNSLR